MKSKKVSVSARRRRLIIVPFVALVLCSCGVTKATISRPAEGTTTTITISTNNPISTDVSPNVTIQSDKDKK